MPFEKTPPSPPAVPVPVKRLSLAPYIAAALIFVVGAGSFVFFLFERVSGLDDKLVQVVVPGGREVTLSEPGEYTIFHEYRSVVGNEVFSTAEEIAGLQGRVTSQKTGAEIPLASAGSSARYDIGGRSGYSVFEFRIDEPGIYRIEGRYASGADGPRTVLSVGKGFLEDILVTVFLGIAILFGSTVLSAAIAVITFLKRQKTARSAAY